RWPRHRRRADRGVGRSDTRHDRGGRRSTTRGLDLHRRRWETPVPTAGEYRRRGERPLASHAARQTPSLTVTKPIDLPRLIDDYAWADHYEAARNPLPRPAGALKEIGAYLVAAIEHHTLQPPDAPADGFSPEMAAAWRKVFPDSHYQPVESAGGEAREWPLMLC